MPTAVESAITEMQALLAKFIQAEAGMGDFQVFADQHHASRDVKNLVVNLRQQDRVLIRELQEGIQSLQVLLDDGYPNFPKAALKQNLILELQAERDAIKAAKVQEAKDVDAAFAQFILDAGVTSGKITFGAVTPKKEN